MVWHPLVGDDAGQSTPRLSLSSSSLLFSTSTVALDADGCICTGMFCFFPYSTARWCC